LPQAVFEQLNYEGQPQAKGWCEHTGSSR